MEKSIRIRNSAGIIIIITCLFSFGYAILRYHIAGPVPWKDLPLYTLNKGISLSALVLLIFNFSFGPLKNLGVKVPEAFMIARKELGMIAFLLVLIHIIVSLLLFKPAIYGKFFHQNETLTLAAGISMLGGVISFVLLWFYSTSFKSSNRDDEKLIRFIKSRNFTLSAGLFLILHLFFMGYKSWLTPGDWHGGLPPISLLSFVFFIGGYIINIFGRK